MPFATGVSHVGRHTADGERIEDKDAVKVPYELHFKSDWTGLENTEDKLKWYDPLKDIPAESELFQVWAWNTHKDCEGAVFE